jgi:hypothetical protein
MSNAVFDVQKYHDMFELYAENFTEENDRNVRAISFNNFSAMTFDLNLFDKGKLKEFSGLNEEAEAARKIEELVPEIEERFSKIKRQLGKVEKWKYYIEELGEILIRLRNDLIEQSNPYCVWIGFRLMEEESKLVENNNA